MFANREQGSMIRNPLIATVLYCDRSIDAFGTGFERVFRLCPKENYHYSNNQFGFTFEFIRSNIRSNSDLIFDSKNELTEIDLKVLNIIRSGRKVKKDEIAREIGKSSATVQRSIKKLIEKGFIQRTGSNKTGFWLIKDDRID